MFFDNQRAETTFSCFTSLPAIDLVSSLSQGVQAGASIHSFNRSFISLLVHSSIHSFSHLFIHSFIQALIQHRIVFPLIRTFQLVPRLTNIYSETKNSFKAFALKRLHPLSVNFFIRSILNSSNAPSLHHRFILFLYNCHLFNCNFLFSEDMKIHC